MNDLVLTTYRYDVLLNLHTVDVGTCESAVCVRIESRIESAVGPTIAISILLIQLICAMLVRTGDTTIRATALDGNVNRTCEVAQRGRTPYRKTSNKRQIPNKRRVSIKRSVSHASAGTVIKAMIHCL